MLKITHLSYEVYAAGVAVAVLLLIAMLWQLVRTRGVVCFQRVH